MIAAVFAAAVLAAVSAPYDLDALGAEALWMYPDIDWATVDTVEFITPAPEAASVDYTDVGLFGCTSSPAAFTSCTEGRPDAERHVILAGDSKTAQWHPAIAPIALRHRWRLTTTAFAACPLTAAGLMYQDAPYHACAAWTTEAVDFILAEHPDLLIVSGGRLTAYPMGGDPAALSSAALEDGYVELWQTFVDAGIPVAVILNNPIPEVEMWRCAAEHRDELSVCTFGYDAGVRRSGAQVQWAAAHRVPGVMVVDLAPWICPHRGGCPAVIGNVMVYGWQSHLTRTYVTSLRPFVGKAFLAATGGMFGEAP